MFDFPINFLRTSPSIQDISIKSLIATAEECLWCADFNWHFYLGTDQPKGQLSRGLLAQIMKITSMEWLPQ